MVDMLCLTFTALAIHITWFHSGLPAHVFGILRKLGLGRNLPGFWTDTLDETTNYRSWFVWINTHAYIKPLLAELLTCPVCLSWHIAFWVVAVGFITGVSWQECLTSIPLSVCLCFVVHTRK